MSAEAPSTVRDLVDGIRNGSVTSEQLVSSCLERIDSTDAEIAAWQSIDRDAVLDSARALDEQRRGGKPLGRLHGIPVGIKDIFDTEDLPTERGSPIYEGRQPTENAALIEKLYEAGAVVLGKTVTTELAWMHPAATRNPYDMTRTPGGSSSGSAAAVAAGQVPLTIGSQTGGSTIRPASFCGIVGVKPSRGIISRRGGYQTSQTLDQVGVFAADLGDAALLIDVLGGFDRTDSMSYLAPRPGCLEGFQSEVPVEPNFAWIDMPYSDLYSDAVRGGSEELLEALGGQVERIPAPQSFAVLIETHRIIYDYEIYRNLEFERSQKDSISETFRKNMERAAKVTEAEYKEAQEIHQSAQEWFQSFFLDYDAILTPSAVSEAPPLEEGTGNGVCCVIWTLCGLPCISLPLLVGENELPVGVQLVGAYNEDDRLVRTAHWLQNFLSESED